MSKRIFTQEHINILLKNKHVARCSERSITYHNGFKLAAVRRHQEGLPPTAIFTEAGFNLALIGRKEPKWCLERWRRTFRQKGADGFVKETRGGPGRRRVGQNMSDHERLTYYETQIAYLKAENAFLAKLRKRV